MPCLLQDGIHAGSLGSENFRLLVNVLTNASFSEPGALLFTRGPRLYAQPFDVSEQRLYGQPSVIADRLLRLPGFRYVAYSASRNGGVVYRMDSLTSVGLVWADRAGKRIAPASDVRQYLQFSLSPELIDLPTGITSRVTTNPTSEDTVVWPPDGTEIIFSSYRSGLWNPYRKSVGGGEEELLFRPAESVFPCEWLTDGSTGHACHAGSDFAKRRSVCHHA